MPLEDKINVALREQNCQKIGSERVKGGREVVRGGRSKMGEGREGGENFVRASREPLQVRRETREWEERPKPPSPPPPQI